MFTTKARIGMLTAVARSSKYANKKVNLARAAYVLVALGTILGSSLAGRIHTTYAANTILGSNNEVITISTTDGQPINASYDVLGYTGDGSALLFRSAATNLPNSGIRAGLYVYNIKTNTTTRVDVSSSGVPADFMTKDYPKLSETGRYVIFSSAATNLIDGTTGSGLNVYKHDMQTGVTTLFPSGYYIDTGGADGDRTLGVSNDGRFVLLGSRYTANAYPYPYGIAFGDGGAGSYTWTSLAKGDDGSGGNNSTDLVGGLSCDGAFAVYQHRYDVQLTDLRHNTTTTLTAGNAMSTSPIISCNGRYVLYATTNRTDITPTPTGMNAYLHLVRYDRITDTRMYIDSNSTGTFSKSMYSYATGYPAPRNTFSASVSDTGDVVFKYNTSSSSSSMYLKHLSDGSGTLEPIAKTVTGASLTVTSGSLTSDGRYIFFSADPYDLGLASSPVGTQIIRVKTGI